MVACHRLIQGSIFKGFDLISHMVSYMWSRWVHAPAIPKRLSVTVGSHGVVPTPVIYYLMKGMRETERYKPHQNTTQRGEYEFPLMSRRYLRFELRAIYLLLCRYKPLSCWSLAWLVGSTRNNPFLRDPHTHANTIWSRKLLNNESKRRPLAHMVGPIWWNIVAFDSFPH